MAYPNDDRPYGATDDTVPATDRAREVAATAQDEALNVADTAKDAGGHVLDTAKQEAGQVLDEAKLQGRRLLDSSVEELRAQAGTGQHLVAELARSLSGELRSMANTGDDGMLSDYVHRAQRFTDDAAQWLDTHQPDEVLDSVRRYAARNPWQFLAISAGVGFLGARLVRGLQGAKSDEEKRAVRPSQQTSYPTPAYDDRYPAPLTSSAPDDSTFRAEDTPRADVWREDQR